MPDLGDKFAELHNGERSAMCADSEGPSCDKLDVTAD